MIPLIFQHVSQNPMRLLFPFLCARPLECQITGMCLLPLLGLDIRDACPWPLPLVLFEGGCDFLNHL